MENSIPFLFSIFDVFPNSIFHSNRKSIFIDIVIDQYFLDKEYKYLKKLWYLIEYLSVETLETHVVKSEHFLVVNSVVDILSK